MERAALLLLPEDEKLIDAVIGELKRLPRFVFNRRLVGVVLIEVEPKGKLLVARSYKSEVGDVRHFDPDEKEVPYCYRTGRGVLAALGRARNSQGAEYGFHGYPIHLAVWCHPECDADPLPKYLAMTGVKFTGCPRK